MKLNSGIDFVTGNRRSPESYFHFPVSIMPFVYSRHMCGIYFNQVVRFLFGLESRDTQAGIKAMTRDFARTSYALQACPGFLFDIEFFMVAQANGLKHTEIPVHLNLDHQVTTIKICKELVVSFYWLSKIFIKKMTGHYKQQNALDHHEEDCAQECHIAADDWGLSPAINRGILKLAQGGIVKRVSVMPECSFANYLLDDLKKIKDLEIGLHLNFTYKKKVDSPLKFLFFMFNPLISPRFKKSYIQEQIDSQLKAMQNLDLHPMHIDGHHHCHIFPYVAPLVAQTAEKLKIKQTRLPTESSLWLSNKFLLPFLSLFAKKSFEKHQLNYRPFFYPTLKLLKDDAKLRKALSRKSGFEVIVHPADEADLHLNDCADHYNHERVIEYKSLTNL
ncbi:MAG: hypothetical protein COW00_12055 [Bdellovibrio sp. CG12_big_fil_rev_8_21_14_0_65_39_13]|nr:MAG: hypothetical protein COW78_16185 [Bdellovibrio sp. CG22_combo_CG10-13_8_21_14_all_39_27]PIQ59148.1 MAG: hypothetical protein COW00_12055 [Bdellovibrio sp. CG12_big_fil_rev_8_21_14_0_65_39_13]PIR33690.1 MAG: hypothetical protein COV37_15450 [Bdellovibrio sp. CG11_big_fil_rev_8_21_14_0_20_39_38]